MASDGRTRIESPTLRKPVPPGQTYVQTFPIYDITPERPQPDLQAYRLRVWGAVDAPHTWTWSELCALPMIEVVADFHCVTRWSKRALVWEGIPTRVILETVRPHDDVVQVMVHCLEGYTTNVPIEYFAAEDSLLALRLNGAPLTPEHGAPLRLVIPQLYAWKSAKYVCGLEFQTRLQPGFWEARGYHLIGDPWAEQRYWEPITRIRAVRRSIRISQIRREDVSSEE